MTHDLDRWRRQLAVAEGSAPADLILAGGSVIDVFTGTIDVADVAIADGKISGIGRYSQGKRIVDCQDTWIVPSFVDPHIHLESSLVWIPEFARAVVPHGTGCVVTDPHEMANVAGLLGIESMRDASRTLPMHVRFTAPSCVPASSLESPGASFSVDEISAMLDWSECVGLGELMNVAGTLSGDDSIHQRLHAATDKLIDGHAPGVRGSRLRQYLTSGVTSDHESTTYDEALEKLQSGLFIMIREGTAEHNLRDLLPLAKGDLWHRCAFCSDDRDCHTLLDIGHVDAIIKSAIQGGLDPVRAIQMATWNPASYWRLNRIGAIAPGYEANIVVLADLESIDVRETYFRGDLAARDGAVTVSLESSRPPESLTKTMNAAPVSISDLSIDERWSGKAIRVLPGQIVTECEFVGDRSKIDPDDDLLKVACVERHHGTGRVGAGWVRGMGLRTGAMASSIAHDAHNIVAVGASDADLLAAVDFLSQSDGGLVFTERGAVKSFLPLSIVGIMSDQPLEHVASSVAHLDELARAHGSTLPSPFGTLAFLALSVIPHARVTDHGFIAVD